MPLAMLAMRKTLSELAKIVAGEIVGDKDCVITGVNGIKEAQKGEITFLANSKYLPLIQSTQASAIIVSPDLPAVSKNVIRVKNPSAAFTKIVSLYSDSGDAKLQGIHKTAVVGKNVKLGKDVALGAYTVIEDGVSIGDGSAIYSGSYVGHKTTVGKNTLVYPNVTIRERTKIGSNVIIHSGSVIGSDGFGFEQVEGVHEKIPQIGIVLIEDDVEIGANVTIDRARFDKTLIGKGTKIDNLVQIAHNVVVGEKCIIVSQVGISGSVKIGKGAILAGQAGVAGHLTIGEGAIAAAQAGVTKSIPPRTTVSGYPARPHDEAKRVNAALQRLPIYVKAIQDLTKRIEELERKLKK